MKTYFHQCCERLNIDANALFYFGISESQQGSRLNYRVSTPKEPRPMFTACYFQSMNVFAVWKLEIYNRACFYVKKSEADKVIPNQVLLSKKHLNKRNGPIETVYIFQPGSLDLFLKTYVLPLIKK